MNLSELQTGILDLIKSRNIDKAGNSSDYLSDVKTSKELLVVRKVALWWRKLQIESFCTLTSSLLIYKDSFHEEVNSFYNSIPYSPYRDEVGLQFLEYTKTGSKDPFVRTVAAFELALIQLKKDKEVSLLQTWPYEPYSVISGLLNHSISDEYFKEGHYLVEVSSDNPSGLFTVIPISGS